MGVSTSVCAVVVYHDDPRDRQIFAESAQELHKQVARLVGDANASVWPSSAFEDVADLARRFFFYVGGGEHDEDVSGQDDFDRNRDVENRNEILFFFYVGHGGRDLFFLGNTTASVRDLRRAVANYRGRKPRRGKRNGPDFKSARASPTHARLTVVLDLCNAVLPRFGEDQHFGGTKGAPVVEPVVDEVSYRRKKTLTSFDVVPRGSRQLAPVPLRCIFDASVVRNPRAVLFTYIAKRLDEDLSAECAAGKKTTTTTTRAAAAAETHHSEDMNHASSSSSSSSWSSSWLFPTALLGDSSSSSSSPEADRLFDALFRGVHDANVFFKRRDDPSRFDVRESTTSLGTRRCAAARRPPHSPHPHHNHHHHHPGSHVPPTFLLRRTLSASSDASTASFGEHRSTTGSISQ